jgi:hypothetical protein
MTVAATTGNVLSTDGFTNRRKVAKVSPAPVPPPQPAPNRANEDLEEIAESPGPSGKGAFQDAGDEIGRFGKRVGRHMERRGRQVGDFFYNLFHKDKRDTAGPHGSEPDRATPPPPPPRASGDTDYVSPSRVRD